MYFFFQFFCTLHYLHHRHMYELYREWVMQHISQTILKENQEVVNLILQKTSSNYCTFTNFAFCTLGLYCILLILYLGVNDPPYIIYLFTGIYAQSCGHPSLTGLIYLFTGMYVQSCGHPCLIGLIYLFTGIFVESFGHPSLTGLIYLFTGIYVQSCGHPA